MSAVGATGADTFPRQHARTRRFTLGEPRNIVVSDDGARVLFARSAAGHDPVNALWVLDTADGRERLVCDPRAIAPEDHADTTEERRRRERAREGAGGVVAFATDRGCVTAALVLGGQLVIVDIATGAVKVPDTDAGVFDPRPSPDGSRVAFVRDGALFVRDLHDDAERRLAGEDAPEITWGLAEFIAAEEMGRHRGHWWSPDGGAIAACRVDTTAVATWHLADPSDPAAEPTTHRYPAAGGTNASVELWILDPSGATTPRRCDLGKDWEYLCAVNWTPTHLLVMTQSRDQRTTRVLRVDPSDGSHVVVVEDRDDHWIELVPGTPSTVGTGSIVTCSDRDGARRLCLDAAPVTPSWLQVRSVLWCGDKVVFAANPIGEPRRVNVWEHDPVGATLRPLVDGPVTASATLSADGTVMVTRSTGIEVPATVVVHCATGPHTIVNNAETPLVEPRARFHRVGDRSIETAILVPTGGGDGPWPVIFDPYGGPHAQRVVEARNAYLAPQWLADRGFVVVIADGRGTPGRGSDWERAVSGDLATCVLEDQIEVLDALPELEPRADTSRVAITGWSFGGFLAALAVLRAPGKFHCAVAGAPVCDWRLYDTHYTERYLGSPDADPEAYRRSSLLEDAPRLERPLLLIHGLSDDNVVVAHTLRMSAALLAAGRDHEVLPLSGVTHMTPQETVAENLLLHEVAFIRRALAV